MNSLFIEASAKTSVGVSEAFQEVVERILDTPELWTPVTADKGIGRSGTSAKDNSGKGMPGNINLREGDAEEQYSGCSC